MMRKIIILAHKSIDGIVIFISFLLFLICVYATVDAYMVYSRADDNSILKYKPVLNDSSALQELSDEAVAWITIDNTKIDFPVMQGKTNEEFLNKDPYGNYSLSGSIFLDFRNTKDFSDSYSLLYGHHMEYNAMFGGLDQYSKKEYFDTHKSGTLIVLNNKSYRIKLFAACKAQATERVVFNPAESNNKALLNFLKNNAFIYEPQNVNEKSKIIGLSTCQSAENIERLIVFGVLNEVKQQ